MIVRYGWVLKISRAVTGKEFMNEIKQHGLKGQELNVACLVFTMSEIELICKKTQF